MMGPSRTIFASLVLTCVFAAQAQPLPKIPRIGVFFGSAPSQTVPTGPAARAFVQGLEDYGWRPGQNIEIVWRGATAATIEELVGMPADILVVNSDEVAHFTMTKTRRIPIVLMWSSDPVAYGLAKSLSRPGGNVTGIVDFTDPHMDGKRLQLLKQAAPRVNRVVYLHASNESVTFTPELVADAKTVGISIFEASVAAIEIERAIESAVRQGANGMVVVNQGKLNNPVGRAIVQREAIRHRLPAIYEAAVSEEDLIAYGTSWDNQRRSAYFVDRILKGAKPADLPIERIAKPRLMINLRAARAIGLTIPDSVLIQADRVIE
jgi:putative ABC transport system substrate-binding protein